MQNSIFAEAIFILFLDVVLLHLETRFFEHRQLLTKIENIIPVHCRTSLNVDGIRTTAEILEAEWPDDVLGYTSYFRVGVVAQVKF